MALVSPHSDGPSGSAGLPVSAEDFGSAGSLIGDWRAGDPGQSLSTLLVDSCPNRSIAGAAHPLLGSVTAQRPTYEASGWGGVAPSYLFNTSQLRADGLASYFSGSNRPFTFAMSIQWVTAAAARYLWSAASSSDPDCVVGTRSSGTSKWNTQIAPDSGGAANLESSTNTDTNRHILVCRSNGTILEQWIDTAKNPLTGISVATIGAATTDRLGIGAYVRTTPTAHGHFRYGRILLFAEAVEDAAIPFIQRLLIDTHPI